MQLRPDGKHIYPACVSRHYAPEELRSMEIWDSFCEAEPLTWEEIRACNARDRFFKVRKPGAKKKYPYKPGKSRAGEYYRQHEQYFSDYRKAHREEINARQRAYDAAHREEKNRKKREYRRRKRLEKIERDSQPEK